MRRDPALVDLRHPVVGLPQRVIGIARARPVAQRHRRGHARLARVYHLPRLVGERGEIEKIGLVAAQGLDRLLRVLREPPGLGDLARAGVLAARRAIDDQDARAGARAPSGASRRPRASRAFPTTRRTAGSSGRRSPSPPAGYAAPCGSGCIRPTRPRTPSPARARPCRMPGRENFAKNRSRNWSFVSGTYLLSLRTDGLAMRVSVRGWTPNPDSRILDPGFRYLTQKSWGSPTEP